MNEMDKPRGIESRWDHDTHRIKEILDAIERYNNVNMTVPKSWIVELIDLFNVWLK